ncbi:MAG TPA: flagellar hook-associated protein FlgK [Anaerovoracaceae bacterium]|nr:flagellar hook-associated protein FlgK [Anaerovoracaceae bacterium]
MRPTFLSFQTAARAMAASQANMDITGNNLANVNTDGYSRQRVDLNAIASSGYKQKYASSQTFVDSGVQVAGIGQFRDPFLDARYRSETSDDNKYNTILSGLSDLENSIDEATTKGLQNELSNYITQLQKLKQQSTSQDFALVARTAAQKVTEMLNVYGTQIEEVRNQQIYDLDNVVVSKDFNSITENIADLNSQIREEEIYGNTPNDLYDKRNSLLDELSGIANIKVTVSPEKISDNLTVGKLTVALYDPETSTSIGLVDGDLYNTLTVNSDKIPLTISLNSSFSLKGTPATVDTSNITNYFTGGSIKGYLDLINGNGSYADTNAGESNFRGTLYYTSVFDSFASSFAQVFNDINDIDPADTVLNADDAPLFSSGLSGGKITAKNIQVSTEWLENPSYINTTKDPVKTPSAADNIDRMIDAMNVDQKFYKTPGDTTSDVLFTGSFHQYVVGAIGELSLDVELNDNFAATSGSVMLDLYSKRESISGVNMDEEGINLMAFQKSYNAAARYFTVLDEAVDTIINSMGIVGR